MRRIIFETDTLELFCEPKIVLDQKWINLVVYEDPSLSKFEVFMQAWEPLSNMEIEKPLADFENKDEAISWALDTFHKISFPH